MLIIVLVAWVALSVVAALVLGAMIRLRDRRERDRYRDATPADRSVDWDRP